MIRRFSAVRQHDFLSTYLWSVFGAAPHSDADAEAVFKALLSSRIYRCATRIVFCYCRFTTVALFLDKEVGIIESICDLNTPAVVPWPWAGTPMPFAMQKNRTD
jgi:hypothetical protein